MGGGRRGGAPPLGAGYHAPLDSQARTRGLGPAAGPRSRTDAPPYTLGRPFFQKILDNRACESSNSRALPNWARWRKPRRARLPLRPGRKSSHTDGAYTDARADTE